MSKIVQIGKQAFNPDQIVTYVFLDKHPWKRDVGPCVALRGTEGNPEDHADWSCLFSGADYETFMWWWEHCAEVFDVAKVKAAKEVRDAAARKVREALRDAAVKEES